MTRAAGRGLIVLAVLVSGAAMWSDARAHDGAEIYAQRCAQCHSIRKMATLLPSLGPPDELRARLETLLPMHHAPDPREHERLIDYLTALRPTP